MTFGEDLLRQNFNEEEILSMVKDLISSRSTGEYKQDSLIRKFNQILQEDGYSKFSSFNIAEDMVKLYCLKEFIILKEK